MTISYTSSSLSTARNCLRRYDLQYLRRLSPIAEDALPLQVGTLWHKAHEVKAKGGDPYEVIRAGAPSDLWAKKLEVLYAAHDWRWKEDEYETVEAELQFKVKLNIGGFVVNVEGMMDKVLRDADGRQGILDYKTTSESLDGGYFDRLRMETQVGGIYSLAYRELFGQFPDFALYDVTRKPTINPKKVTKAEHKRMIQDGDPTYYGWVLDDASYDQLMAGSLEETDAMYGARLLADIGTRPEFYFARRPVYRSAEEINALLLDIKSQVYVIEAVKDNAIPMPRNPDACTARGHCVFIGLCERGEYPGDTIPEGFMRRDSLHPELVPVVETDQPSSEGALTDEQSTSPSAAE